MEEQTSCEKMQLEIIIENLVKKLKFSWGVQFPNYEYITEPVLENNA